MKILEAIMMGQIKRDKIAEDMWKDYQRVLSERGVPDEIDEDSEQEFFDSDEWDGERTIRIMFKFCQKFIILLS